MDQQRDEVRRRYAAMATSVATGRPEAGDGGCLGPGAGAADVGCCGPATGAEDADCCGSGGEVDPGRGFGRDRYGDDLRGLPEAAVRASLGSGNPLAVADLQAGESVLDLGCGAGIDVLLAARLVGPSGKAYGVDMTPEMLDLARTNATEAGATNVEFVEALMEDVPLTDGAVDVVVSNCVINLSTDKPAVFAELARLTRPGGRLAISDVVAEDALTPGERAERGSHVGCIAGALSFDEYRGSLEAAGFTEVAIEPSHAVTDGMHSAIVRAVRR